MSCLTTPKPVTDAEDPTQGCAPVESHATPLAVHNSALVASPTFRSIRLLSEFTEFPVVVEKFGIRGTFLFFGSARAMSQEQLDKAGGQPASYQWMTRWYTETQRLGRLLTEWALGAEGQRVGLRCKSHFSNQGGKQPLVVCTGGGPGFMEAANRGAIEAGGLSMGVAITLPFEASLNRYVTAGLNFRTEYFFTRKFWEVYSAKAIICSPGGVGTLDELFEVMTLKQTRHCPDIPLVLLGKEFWDGIVDWKKLVHLGVVSSKDIDDLIFVDTADEAFEIIKSTLVAEVDTVRTPPPEA